MILFRRVGVPGLVYHLAPFLGIGVMIIAMCRAGSCGRALMSAAVLAGAWGIITLSARLIAAMSDCR